MYKGFCIDKDTIHLVVNPYKTSVSHTQRFKDVLVRLNAKESNIAPRIATLLKGDAKGVIDGEALQNACMPTNSNYDIFISHSHTEEKEAKDLAAYLADSYGLKCFVDSFVWGSCDNEILRPLDDIWSTHETKKGSYSYEKRNYSTSLVHAMLSMALLEMIDKCECCFFIKPTSDLIVSSIGDCIASPWIYEEITIFNKIQKRIPFGKKRRCTESDALPRVRYKLDLSDMPLLNAVHLQKNISMDDGITDYTKANRWLDDLYDNVK